MIHRSPLKRSTKPIARISPRQRAREADLRARKVLLFTRLLNEQGYVKCERCPVTYYSLREAMSGLHRHHRLRRHHCDDTDLNLETLCHSCHLEEHS